MISIVMGYYNRLPLVKHTLKTISQTSCSDYEVIIVDDYSDPQHSPNDLVNEFPFVKVVDMRETINPRWYVNPCIVYNTGFRHARGDKIIIQNPECCHIGDVLAYTEANLTNDNFLSFHCFAADTLSTMKLHTTNQPTSLSGGWYNHAQYRPVGYHFCAAITRSNLNTIDGFDERFAKGYLCDDDDFVRRVKLLGVNFTFVDNPWVVHQYHDCMHARTPADGSVAVENWEVFNQTKLENNTRAHNTHSVEYIGTL